MRLHVKGKNVEVSESIRLYAEEKLHKLDRQLHELTQVELELRVEKNPSISANQVAEATIWTKGPTLRAREASGASAVATASYSRSRGTPWMPVSGIVPVKSGPGRRSVRPPCSASRSWSGFERRKSPKLSPAARSARSRRLGVGR